MRHELGDHEWGAIHSMLRNKPRGIPRVDDRRAVLQQDQAMSACRDKLAANHLAFIELASIRI
jgi:transposase